ncbi:hypothetical protein FPV67DRAFT_743058 [Lyophyllum atratum]|nr:hypothetical protein FPV67DRAFT_743058 [Lyophyllum atratum]
MYTDDRPARPQHSLELQHLPVELLLEILCFSSAASATVYRSLLLVSNHFHSLAKFNCLQVVPVVLEGYEQLTSFDYFLRKSPEACEHVRYLWIQGAGLTCWQLIEGILQSCTHIVSLACTSRSLASLCASVPFLHTMCTEVTLDEIWHSWDGPDGLMTTPHGRLLCRQLTHLRLHEGLSPEFPKHQFPRLTHLAFSYRPIKEYLERYSASLKSLPALRRIVVTSNWWRDAAPDASLSELLDLDRRLAVLHCRKGWTELSVWQDGVRGGFSLWDQAKLEREAFKHLNRS